MRAPNPQVQYARTVVGEFVFGSEYTTDDLKSIRSVSLHCQEGVVAHDTHAGEDPIFPWVPWVPVNYDRRNKVLFNCNRDYYSKA
jgi:hypothetical protein